MTSSGLPNKSRRQLIAATLAGAVAPAIALRSDAASNSWPAQRSEAAMPPPSANLSSNIAVSDVLREELAGGTGAGLTGFSQENTYSAGTLGAKVRNITSVADAPFLAGGVGRDDTEAIQKAAQQVGSTGQGQAQLEIPRGDYVLSAAPQMPAIWLNADTHVRGTGGQLRADMQNFYMLWSSGKGNIRVDGVKFIANRTAGNDAQAAVYCESGNHVCRDYSVTFNSMIDTSWGVLVQAQKGSGKFIGARFIGNHIESTTPGTKADGLHMTGRYFAALTACNTIIGRADAAMAFNMVAGYQGYGFVGAAGAHIDNLVGVDISGGQYGVISGINAYNTIDHTGSNPCFRAIRYNGSDPKYIVFNGLLAMGKHDASGEFDGKVDAEGADTHISVSAVMLKSFFTNARFVNINGNHFLQGARIDIANHAGEVFIGPNTFEGIFDIHGQGNAGLAGNVYIARQNWARHEQRNFLPNYSSAKPFWAAHWFFDSDRLPVTLTPFSTSSTTPVDVSNGVFALDRACIVDGILALADILDRSAHISICDMTDNELVRADFPSEAGVAKKNNVLAVLSAPAVAGNPYKVRLNAGVYKLRVWADGNSFTLKCASLAIWC